MNQFQKLKSEMLWCEKCDLHKTRDNVVIGHGDEDANIFLVGEAPGEKESKEGRPFIGKSGKVLRRELEKNEIGDKVFITNIVKCRPPENRDPKKKEIGACSEWIMKEIEKVSPKIIVGVGRISSQFFKSKFLLSRDHGKFFSGSGNDMKFMGTYHPAATFYNKEWKKAFEEDIKKLKEFV